MYGDALETITVISGDDKDELEDVRPCLCPAGKIKPRELR
jgi:hypothetical protein